MPAKRIVRYWMVHSPEGGPPRHVHEERRSAELEAARLARSNPGNHFVVLEARSFIYVEPRHVMQPVSDGPLDDRTFPKKDDREEIPF